MSKPYYQDDLVTLYHGDCLDITAWLEADVLVTDPPYGRDWKQGDTSTKRGWRSDRHDGIANDSSPDTRDAALSEWTDRPFICFGDFLCRPPTGTKCVLVYDKAEAGFTGSVAGFRRNIEAIYLGGRGWKSGLGGDSSVLGAGVPTGGNLARTTGHPHTKPVGLMERLISHCPPGTIADPFAGSGSTLVAAVNQGRKAIGVELEERYCELIAKRLSNQTMSLFGGVS